MEETTQVTLRDLADGTPCPGVEVTLRAPSAGHELFVTSDSGGVIRVPKDWVKAPPGDVSSPYKLAGTTGRSGSPVTAWLYQEIVVTVDVELPAEFEVDIPVSAEAKIVPLPAKSGHPLTQTPPWSRAWLHANGIVVTWTDMERRTDLPRSFTLTMPRVQGIVVVARAPEHRSLENQVTRVAVTHLDRERTVSLSLARGRAVHGRLLLPAGATLPQPLPTVVLRVENTGSLRRADFLVWKLKGQAIGSGASSYDGEDATFTFQTSARVNPDGTYRVPFFERGRAMLLVQVTGFLVEELSLGHISTDRTDLDVQLRPL